VAGVSPDSTARVLDCDLVVVVFPSFHCKPPGNSPPETECGAKMIEPVRPVPIDPVRRAGVGVPHTWANTSILAYHSRRSSPQGPRRLSCTVAGSAVRYALVRTSFSKTRSRQESSRPRTLFYHMTGLLFASSFFSVGLTGLLAGLLTQPQVFTAEFVRTEDFWILIFSGLVISGGAVSFIWPKLESVERLPLRTRLLVMGSTPSVAAQRTLQVAMLFATLACMCCAATALVKGIRSFAPEFGHSVATSDWQVGGEALAMFFSQGLSWLLILGSVRMMRTLVLLKCYPRPIVEPVSTAFGVLNDNMLTLIHLSDCHITADVDTKTTEGQVGGLKAMEMLLSVRRAELQSANAIILTGDAVDSGHIAEWGQLFRLMNAHSLCGKTYLIPGNHEINIPDPNSRLRGFGGGAEFHTFRKVRFLNALRNVRSAQACAFGADNEDVEVGFLIDQKQNDLQSAIEIVDEGLRWLASGSAGSPLDGPLFLPEGYHEVQEVVAKLWKAVFPHWELLSAKLLLIVVDSNARAANLASNGFGEVSQTQLSRLKVLGQRFVDYQPIIAMHHHPVDPPGWSARSGIGTLSSFLSLTNSLEFLSTVATSFRITPIILNGHRHQDVASRISVCFERTAALANLNVYASPSSSYGRGDQRPGYYVLGFENEAARSCLTYRSWHGV